MSEQIIGLRRRDGAAHLMPPWTVAGGADLECSEHERDRAFWMLTDPELTSTFRSLHHDGVPADYEAMIRLLGLVWTCPDDGTVNVTGYRCAGCHASRAIAELAARCRDRR
jgi:hypothetical protein